MVIKCARRATATKRLDAFRRRTPSLVVLDIWLQGSRMDGLELLAMFKEIDSELPVIVISGHGTIETAVSAIRKGAYDFVEKPFNADRLLLVVQRALEAAKLKRENNALKARSSASDESHWLVARDGGAAQRGGACRANQFPRLDRWARWERQRARRAHAARTKPTRRRPVCGDQRGVHRA
jgi:DNA-binding NtrC family response regulator